MWIFNGSHELEAISQWPEIVSVCVSLTAVMMLTVFTRIYVRSFMVRAVGKDDYIIVLSMACSIIYNAMCIAQTRYGLGLPVTLRPQADKDRYTVLNFSGRPFYMAGIMGFKVALCFAYLRITGSGIKSIYRRFIYNFMAFTILSHLGGTFVLIFQCYPIYKSWRPSVAGQCLPNDVTFYVLAAISIACDIVIFITPIPLLARLQINTRRKFALIGLFMLGLFTTVCSVMRMVQIRTITRDGNSTMLILWGTIEMNVGISLTCLPTLTPLFTFFAYRTRSAIARSRNSQSHDDRAHERSESAQGLRDLISNTNTASCVGADTPRQILTEGNRQEGFKITETTDFKVDDCDSWSAPLGRKYPEKEGSALSGLKGGTL